jgi:regulator of cell morphogenesis and NO signaling
VTVDVESLAVGLEHEHNEIDAIVRAFVSPARPNSDGGAMLLHAIRLLRHHIYVEEELLFPALTDQGLGGPVHVMVDEHAEIWRILDSLEYELGTGDEAGAAEKLRDELALTLEGHNLKEEHVLYPWADEILSGSADSRVKSALDSGELPDGWVCRGART